MDIVEVARKLQENKVGVIPTDTVYGVVGLLSSKRVVQRIYEVKRRNPQKPVGTILIASAEQIRDITDPKLLEIATKYWPGPVSVVLPVKGLDYAHKGLHSLPFRVPDDENLREFLRQTGPLATSSANLEGQPPATMIEQAKEYFGDQVDFYSDGGDLSGRKPSRIIEILPDGSEKQIRT